MISEEFSLEAFARNRKYAFDLEISRECPELNLPVLMVRGRKSGKVLVITAGVHGDEYEGVRTVLDTYAALDPGVMQGDLLAVPVANPPAFWNGTRTSPVDGGNLARVFPGSPDGKATTVIAHHLAHSIIGCADFFLDLHSAGKRLLMPTMVGYDAGDQRSSGAALVFGAKVVWAHPRISPGRTISFAKSQGIPWLYTEARGAGPVDTEDLRVFSDGVLNLMRYLSILPGAVAPAPVEFYLEGEGDLDDSILSTSRGFFVPGVDLLEEVALGSELGRLIDLHGDLVEAYRAPREGRVGMMRAWPVVHPGEPMFLLASENSRH